MGAAGVQSGSRKASEEVSFEGGVPGSERLHAWDPGSVGTRVDVLERFPHL